MTGAKRKALKTEGLQCSGVFITGDGDPRNGHRVGYQLSALSYQPDRS